MMKSPDLPPIESTLSPGRNTARWRDTRREIPPPAYPPAISGLRQFHYCYLKRAADLTLVLLAIIFLLSWLLPLLGLLIWLDSGRPLFFIQERIGRNGRVFHCFKLRTMSPIPGSDRKHISRLGRFLRYRKLDELPQLFNVLLGEMSLIGPRPHMISDHRHFSQALGRIYHRRHDVLPGITGLAQVRGYEGPITTYRKLRGRIHLDLFYIEKWSLGLEFWIFWKTLVLLFHFTPPTAKKETD
jgi:putative colanic acid biosynthesis UDP-glucose lipid carrier transferase